MQLSYILTVIIKKVTINSKIKGQSAINDNLTHSSVEKHAKSVYLQFVLTVKIT